MARNFKQTSRLQYGDFHARMYDPIFGYDIPARPNGWINSLIIALIVGLKTIQSLGLDPTGMTDFALNKKTGEITEVVYDNKDEQKANQAAETDRTKDK